jgi:predicted lactoylglutathione lyase
MIKEIWLNLPVKDVDKTKDFFSRIGFSPNSERDCAEMVGFEIGRKKMSVMFVAEDVFREFSQAEIPDPQTGSQILISFDAESREEVDETARKVFEAGGMIFGAPAEIQGWMYGFGFADLDGHRWSMVYMDSAQMPQA